MKTGLTFLLLFFPTLTFAQLHINTFDKYLQQTKIGLVDEFIKRFNGIETDSVVLSNDDNTRKNNLLLLLDLSKYSSEKDTAFIKASEMMDCVIKDSVQINYNDSTWFAIAHCKGDINKKQVNFSIYLSVERKRDSLYKWVITSVSGDFFNIASENQTDKTMLYPDDHETNFISLMRMTEEQPKDVHLFMRKGFNYDVTSVFTYLVYSNQLRIKYVDKLEFVFTQIPGYIFHIEDIARDTGNSGWLITKFYPSSKEDKIRLFSNLKGIPYEPNTKKDTIDENCNIENENSDYNISFDVYKRRIVEQLNLLRDYIHFLQCSEKNEFDYYKAKIENLFNPETKITILDKHKKVDTVMNLSEFCDYISVKQNKQIMIDSISIPIPNVYINPNNNTVVSFNGYLLPTEFIDRNQFIPEESQKLNISIDATEDGFEFIPEFGNMVVKISNNRCRKK